MTTVSKLNSEAGLLEQWVSKSGGCYALSLNGVSSGTAPTITSANSTTFVEGSASLFTVTATGSPAPSFSKSGTLPSGVTLGSASGVLGGTPTNTGTFSITITAANGVAPNATQSFTLTVNWPGFKTNVTYTIPINPRAIAVGDLTGDGSPDLVAQGTSTSISVLINKNDGSGGFNAGTSVTAPGPMGSGLALAAINKNTNNNLGIVAPLTGGGSYFTMLGNGNGTFQAAVTHAGGPGASLMCADLNGDGKPDLVGTDQGYNAVVCFGNGNGTFGADQVLPMFPSAYQITGIAVGDVNGDGIPDIVACTSYYNVNTTAYYGFISCILSNGDGTFKPAQSMALASKYPFNVAIGDIDGDGKADLAICSWTQDLVTLLGNGNGTFKSETNVSANPYRVIALSNATLNGKLSIVVTGFSTSTVSVFPGNGDGTFGTERTFSIGGVAASQSGFLVTDLSGDGKPDVAATGGALRLNVLINQ